MQREGDAKIIDTKKGTFFIMFCKWNTERTAQLRYGQTLLGF